MNERPAESKPEPWPAVWPDEPLFSRPAVSVSAAGESYSRSRWFFLALVVITTSWSGYAGYNKIIDYYNNQPQEMSPHAALLRDSIRNGDGWRVSRWGNGIVHEKNEIDIEIESPQFPYRTGTVTIRWWSNQKIGEKITWLSSDDCRLLLPYVEELKLKLLKKKFSQSKVSRTDDADDEPVLSTYYVEYIGGAAGMKTNCPEEVFESVVDFISSCPLDTKIGFDIVNGKAVERYRHKR